MVNAKTRSNIYQLNLYPPEHTPSHSHSIHTKGQQGPKHEYNLANQHKAIAPICMINIDRYMQMSALMPGTIRKTTMPPPFFPLRKQNTNNQTHANASTSAAHLTAGLGPNTTCPGPLCQPQTTSELNQELLEKETFMISINQSKLDSAN